MEANIGLIGKLRSKQKIIFNSFWVISDRILRLLGGLIVGIWVSRYLGPYNFGEINFALSIIAVCTPFINMGMNNVVLTDLIKTEGDGEIVYTSLLLKLISGSLIFLGIYIFSFTMHDEGVARIILIVVAIQCIFQGSDIFDLYNQSRTESRNSVMAKSSAYIVLNLMKVLGLVMGYSIIFFAALTAMESILSAIILAFFYFKISKQSISTWVFNKPFALKLLLRSWPLIIADVFVTFYMRLDQLMLKFQAGFLEVGRYSAVVKISEMHYFLSGTICISVYPTILRLRNKSEDAFLHGFQRLFNILTTISVTIAIIVTFSAGWLTHMLYGHKFQGLGPILAVHIWTGVFVFLGVGASNWFYANNLQKYLLVFTAIGLGINATLNLILIPRYLSLGSAIATLIAQMFAAVFCNCLFKKTRPIFWLQMKSFLVFIKPSSSNYL
jgi:O-antigen/teichoic acid export membrane protein